MWAHPPRWRCSPVPNPATTEPADGEPVSTEPADTESAGSGPRELGIPELSLVVLIGVSGSGKTTFARRHFGPFEVISSDFCRGLVADDENDQAATPDAFDVLTSSRASAWRPAALTVVDATNVQPAARKQFVELARATTCCPSRSCWTCRKALHATKFGSRPDRTFGSRSFTASMTSCAGRCGH